MQARSSGGGRLTAFRLHAIALRESQYGHCRPQSCPSGQAVAVNVTRIMDNETRVTDRCVRLLAATGRAHRLQAQSAADEASPPRRNLQQIAADSNVPLAGLSVQVLRGPAPHLADADLALCRLRPHDRQRPAVCFCAPVSCSGTREHSLRDSTQVGHTVSCCASAGVRSACSAARGACGRSRGRALPTRHLVHLAGVQSVQQPVHAAHTGECAAQCRHHRAVSKLPSGRQRRRHGAG